MKILNLYAGVGGNRMYWGNDHEITAVEPNPSVAACYKDLYPNDTVMAAMPMSIYSITIKRGLIFIWATLPCQSHSDIRHGPDKAIHVMPYFSGCKLWQEIVFLTHFCKKDWVVENIRITSLSY